MSTLDTQTTQPPRAKLAGVALFTGPLFLAEVAVNSWLSRDYLHSHGWALRGGHDLPWPSMLALGPYGWAQVLAFAVAGAGVLCAVPALARTLPDRRRRWVAVTLVVMLGAGVALSAARVDASMVAGQGATTWHGLVHGLMFVVLLPTTVLAPLAVAWAARRDTRWRPIVMVSAFVPIGLIAAFVSRQGNLGFYLFLCIVFGWAAAVATTAARLDR